MASQPTNMLKQATETKCRFLHPWIVKKATHLQFDLSIGKTSPLRIHVQINSPQTKKTRNYTKFIPRTLSTGKIFLNRPELAYRHTETPTSTFRVEQKWTDFLSCGGEVTRYHMMATS